MKRLLPLFSGFLFSAMLQAQPVETDEKKFKREEVHGNAFADFFVEKNSTDTTDLVPPKAYLVHPKPGIHRLPQDNMPCIVPNLTLTVPIKNLWAEKIELPFRGKPPRLPNPSKSFKLAPSRPLTIYPDGNTK